MAETADRLEVRVVSVEDLGLVEGSLPSTFVEMEVGMDRKRTLVVMESKNPVFNSDPIIFTDLVSNGVESVLIYVKHLTDAGLETPLGALVVPMDTPYNSPHMEIDGTFDLEHTTGMPLDEAGRSQVRGRIHLKYLYVNVIDPDVVMLDGGDILKPAPNQLCVQVIDGKDIGLALGYKGGVDAVVQVTVGELRASSRVSNTSNYPDWNDTITLPVVDGDLLVDIRVVHSAFMRRAFLGRVRFSLNEVASAGEVGFVRSFPLYDETLQYRNDADFGSIQLHLSWTFSEEVRDEQVQETVQKKGLLSRAVGGLGGAVIGGLGGVVGGLTGIKLANKKSKAGAAISVAGLGDAAEDEDLETIAMEAMRLEAAKTNKRVADQFDLANMSPFELSVVLDEQRRQRTAEISELLLTPADDLDMPEGDYNIMLHLLELNDVRTDPSGRPPNPMVYIECFGKKFHSKPLYGTTSDFYDEVFYFTMPNLKREQILESFVKMTVVDHFKLDVLKRGWFDSTIGVYTLDLATIYNNKNHELHRKWGTLRDPHNDLDSGPQGLVKFSAVCLGPGDVQRMHDPQKEEDEAEAEDQLENDLDKTEGAGLVDVGMTSRVPGGLGGGSSQSLQFLVIGVMRADGLPGFDRFVSSTRNGLYAYVQCEFAGCKPVKTTKVLCSGKENLSITFEEELWLPVWVPTLCKRVAISIRNSELGRADQTIATAYVDFQGISKYSENPVKSSAFSMLGGSGTYDGKSLQLLHFYGANPKVRTGPKAARFMNKFPNHGSAYRGSITCSLRIVKQSRLTEAAHRETMSYEIPQALLPEYTTYSLKAMVYQGSDFGSSGARPSRGGGVLYSTEYCLSISIGDQEVRTAFKKYADGSVDWLELCEKSNLLLPKNLSQLPDAFVTVYKGSLASHNSVAFLRMKTVELLATGIKTVPKWYDLKHDQSHSATATNGFPGSVLLRLSLVNMQDVGLTGDWEAERKKLRMRTSYCLRVMIYQCRGLPAVNDSALIDPYCKVRFCGAKQKTATMRNTLNPIFFETLDFHKDLPTNLRLAPNLLVQIWDNKILGKFPVAALRVPLSEMKVSKNVNFQADEAPTWMRLHGVDGEGDMGEILVRFVLMEKTGPDQTVQPARAIEPSLRKCFIDIHAIGLRGLVSPGISSIRMPYLYFDLYSNGYGDSAKSEPSRIPSATDPNFLDRHIMQTNLPDNPLYAPVLEVHVYDSRYTEKTLLGIISVDLRSKLPWNGDEYVPPRQHSIMNEAGKAKEVLAREKEKLAEQKRENVKKAHRLNKSDKLGVQLGEEEEEEESGDEKDLVLATQAKDEGDGVFPVEAGASEAGTQYATLPPIVDGDEESQGAARRAKMYEKEREQDASGASNEVSSKEEDALLKKLIGFPTSWTSHDFLSGRDWWMNSLKSGEGGQLEDYLQTYAFENYDLMRGHVAFNKFRRRKNTLRKVGFLKAVIRVTAKNPRYDEEYTTFAKAYRTVEKAVVRLYVIRAQHLLPTDVFGSSSSKQAADPYLKIKLGDTEFRDVSNVQRRNLNPDFFSCYEFQTTIAGPTKLQLGVWDKNHFSADTLMGETMIDLEDRWFHPKWAALDMKPAEVRTLYKLGGGSNTARAGNNTSQGLVTIWVDVLSQAEASLEENAQVQISGPERMKFQLRIVTWRSQDVPAVDNGASDLFMRYNMQGSTDTFMTDTHWRCKDGNGSWNYRSLIPLELPIKKREEGRLKMVMMERNILTANTLIGTNIFNLYDWLMLAYQRQSSVFPLKEKKEKMKQLNRMVARADAVEEGTTGSDGEDSGNDSAGDGDGSDSGDDGDEDDNMGDMGGGEEYDDSQPLLPAREKKGGVEYGSTSKKNNKKKRKDKARVADADKLEGEIEMGPMGAEDEDKESNIGAIFNQINVYLGVGDSVADDADWFDIKYKDKDMQGEISKGRIAVSLSIVPEAEYENDPVGKGREEPNKDPYLPPPNGRLSFSLNPMAIFYELCSPRVICILVCCLCCILIFTVMMVVGTQLSGFVALMNILKGEY